MQLKLNPLIFLIYYFCDISKGIISYICFFAYLIFLSKCLDNASEWYSVNVQMLEIWHGKSWGERAQQVRQHQGKRNGVSFGSLTLCQNVDVWSVFNKACWKYLSKWNYHKATSVLDDRELRTKNRIEDCLICSIWSNLRGKYFSDECKTSLMSKYMSIIYR